MIRYIHNAKSNKNTINILYKNHNQAMNSITPVTGNGRLSISILFLIFSLSSKMFVFASQQNTSQNTSIAKSQHQEHQVPPSSPPIPPELIKQAQAQTQEFLKFFKTPKQQFMPLGFFAMAEDMRNIDILSKLQERGINFVHKYGSVQRVWHAITDLRAAQVANIGVLQNLPSAYVASHGTRFWQDHISALAASNQILAWYLPEEAKPADIPKLKQIADIIRTTDSMKRPIITYASQANAEYLRRVAAVVDVLVFGAYPSLYMPRPRADIKRRIDTAYESGAPVVVAALESLKGRRNWTRRKDVRFDAYLSLVSGAKGIMWYGYYYARSRPKLVESILEVAMELNGSMQLGEVLLTGEQPTSLTCTLVEGPAHSPPTSAYEENWQANNTFTRYDSLQWTARKHKGALYIFAVNAAQKVVSGPATDDGGSSYSVTAKFGPFNSDSSKVDVIGEERSITPSLGYFSDSFLPLAVHIYKIPVD